ncbi:LysM peptidoglycan-binding domain-containing protein [Microbacterium lacus]|uniref:muramidase family protein n=1 Tax=Microbacterium lacus TaxID=415217 RepID=UPI00384BF193
MRPETRALRTRRTNTLAAGVPAAVVGSIALALGGSPAVADERVAPLTLRASAPAVSPLVAVKTAVVKASAAATTYTVARGDTVSTIAQRHGLRTADVLAINGLSWSSIIYPGQVLKLSAGVQAAPAPAVSAPATPAASGSYTVNSGDSISRIASRHGVSTQAVLSANGLGWSSIIFPGQTLRIPGSAAPAAAVPAAAAPAPPAAPAAPTASGTYTVRAGDTISGIASRHGITIQSVFTANGLGWSSIIFPGQTLRISGAAAPAATAPSAPAAPAAPAGQASANLDAEQAANAKIIIGVGRDLGVSDKGIAIALGTAMVESWIRNLDWGDRDSLGLFQQRPSTGWGTEAEVRDPVRAAKAFFGGPSDPNGYRTRGLLDIPGWQNMSFAQAAQAVQVSAYPDRYATWEQSAYGWLAAHG